MYENCLDVTFDKLLTTMNNGLPHCKWKTYGVRNTASINIQSLLDRYLLLHVSQIPYLLISCSKMLI